MLKLGPRRAEWARDAVRARETTLKLWRAGITLGTGTDIWQVPTGVHMEMEEMVTAGLPPLEAIKAATAGAARILGAEAELGTIAVEAGRPGDTQWRSGGGYPEHAKDLAGGEGRQSCRSVCDTSSHQASVEIRQTTSADVIPNAAVIPSGAVIERQRGILHRALPGRSV